MSTTLNLKIADTADDGFCSAGSIDWEPNPGDPAGWYGPGPREYAFAASFPGCTVPQGAAIVSAIFSAYVTDISQGPFALRALAQKIASAAQPNGVSNRPLVDWAMTTAQTTYGSATPPNNAYLAFDITAVLQELVNQASWDSGRANIILRNNGMSGATSQLISLNDYGSTPANAAKLDITYSTASSAVVAAYLQSLKRK